LEIIEIHSLVALFIGAFGSRRSAQEVEGVSISNRGLNHVLVWIHGNLMKNMFGKKISFDGEGSWSETMTEWAGTGQ
jgi:hypothetical protein